MKSFSKNYPRTYKAIKYGGSALKVAHQAYNMAKVVASIVNPERKYFDVPINTAPDTNASITCLTNMAQGDTTITRNGNSVALKSLQVDGIISWDSTNPTERVRVMMVRDNDNLGGTAPAITDILESANIIGLRNKNTPKRFTVLYDKLHTCNTSQLTKHISYYKKFKMLKDKKGNPTVSQHLYFDGATANDYTRGHIFLIMLGSTATASTTSTFTANTRIRFYDN